MKWVQPKVKNVRVAFCVTLFNYTKPSTMETHFETYSPVYEFNVMQHACRIPIVLRERQAA
jgi:hypothetical protein